MSNLAYRMDDRTPEEFRKDISSGANLQKWLADICDRLLGCCGALRRLYEYSGVVSLFDDRVHGGQYVDCGDGYVIFGAMKWHIELKTKEINSPMFSLKLDDLQRCFNGDKINKIRRPIIMANRMCSPADEGLGSFEALDEKGIRKRFWISRAMKIRCMGLDEIGDMLLVRPVELRHMGNKLGYIFEEDWFDDWISVEETDALKIIGCFRECFPDLMNNDFHHDKEEEYSWEKHIMRGRTVKGRRAEIAALEMSKKERQKGQTCAAS